MNHLRQHRHTVIIPLVLAILLVPQIASASWYNPISWVASAADEVLQAILFTFVTNVFGLFVWLGAAILDAGIDYFVLGFGGTFLHTGMGVAVDNTWVIIRDVTNMFFIFGLVYIGFKLILDIDSAGTRRALVNLIMAALLINFSLFITKFTIDISNQLASEIAVAGLGANCDEKTGKCESDISAKFFQRMGISKILSGMPEGVGYGYIMGTGVLLLVTAFVFAAGGILLIIRFAVLCIFLLLSPLMFAGWILSPFGNTMSKYWNAFIKRCFFPPIYLLMLYFSLQIIGGLQNSIDSTSNTNLANPNWAGIATDPSKAPVEAGTLGTLPFFILICVFMMGSLVAANKLSADGATWAQKMAGKATFGLAGHAGRKTFGKGASMIAKSDMAKRNPTLRRAAGFVASSSFDFRNAPGVGASLGAISSLSGTKINPGEAQKGGFKAEADARKKKKEDREKEQAAFDKELANNAAIKAGLPAHTAREEEEKRRTAAGAAAGDVEVNRGGVTSFVNPSLLTPEEKAKRKEEDDNISAMQRVVADMNIKQFEDMSKEEQVAIAGFMSGSLTESVMKSDKISDPQKEKIANQQKETILKSIRDRNGNIISENLNNLSIRQIETLGDQFVSDNAALFNDNLFTEVKKSKKFTESQVGGYVNKRKTDILNMVNNPATAAQAFTQTYRDPNTGTVQRKARKTTEIAKLPGDALANPNAVQFLTVDVLKAIASGDKEFERVSTQQRETILNNLEAQLIAPGPLDPRIAKALHYLHSSKGQEDFIGN